MHRYLVIAALGALLLFGGCAKKQEQPPAVVAPHYAPTSTIKDIMDNIVDPEADIVWAAVSTTIGPKGYENKVPRTDADWVELRRHAIILFEASNLLVMPGRHVAKPGEKSENKDIEESPEAIEAHINGDRATFENRVDRFRNVVTATIAAVDKKDVKELEAASDKLDSACESCHITYWYPKDNVSQKLFEDHEKLNNENVKP